MRMNTVWKTGLFAETEQYGHDMKFEVMYKSNWNHPLVLHPVYSLACNYFYVQMWRSQCLRWFYDLLPQLVSAELPYPLLHTISCDCKLSFSCEGTEDNRRVWQVVKLYSKVALERGIQKCFGMVLPRHSQLYRDCRSTLQTQDCWSRQDRILRILTLYTWPEFE